MSKIIRCNNRRILKEIVSFALAYLLAGSVQNLEVVFEAWAWRKCGLRQQSAVESSRGLEGD